MSGIGFNPAAVVSWIPLFAIAKNSLEWRSTPHSYAILTAQCCADEETAGETDNSPGREGQLTSDALSRWVRVSISMESAGDGWGAASDSRRIFFVNDFDEFPTFLIDGTRSPSLPSALPVLAWYLAMKHISESCAQPSIRERPGFMCHLRVVPNQVCEQMALSIFDCRYTDEQSPARSIDLRIFNCCAHEFKVALIYDFNFLDLGLPGLKQERNCDATKRKCREEGRCGTIGLSDLAQSCPVDAFYGTGATQCKRGQNDRSKRSRDRNADYRGNYRLVNHSTIEVVCASRRTCIVASNDPHVNHSRGFLSGGRPTATGESNALPISSAVAGLGRFRGIPLLDAESVEPSCLIMRQPAADVSASSADDSVEGGGV
jgi:hypothetical protein